MTQPSPATPAPRVRRRRRLAAAIRALVQEEGRPPAPQGRIALLAAQLRGRGGPPAVPAPVLDGLRALAADSSGPPPDDADPAELLARMRGAAAIPPEICVAVGAMLLPLLRLANEKDATTP
jgi:hypothetical protein